MANMPNKMKIGVALGMLGGIISFIAMAYSWTDVLESMYPVGVNMLCTVMFFACAGALTSHTPVPGSTVVVIAAVTMAAVVVGGIYAVCPLGLTIVLGLITVGIILIGACPKVSTWIDSARMA